MAQDYYTILTNAGLAYEAACKANQVPIKLTHFAVGDGNGAAYNPGPDATALRRETHRQPINSLLQDEANPSWLMAEALVADDVGGWTIREVGIYTDTGILYAIGKYPDSVKPILAQGSGKQFYVRAIFQTSNAASVTLLVDNSVVMATRAFVLDHVKAELAKLDGKNSVKVATTANLGALSGLLTVDGVVLAAGDRVLVKDQADAKTNGIYFVAAGAWVRATDADASIEVTPGLLVAVEQGAVNGDSIWQLVTDAPITLGTTALVFEIAAGPSGVVAGTYRSVTVDKRGRVSGGSNPTTLAGYGITDAVSASAEASQAEAEAGAAPGKWMSPLRVKQAIDALVPKSTDGIAGSFSGLKAAASGANATVTVTADSVCVKNAAGQQKVLNGVALAINSAAVGVNGLDTGVLAANTWYSKWVIYNPTTQTVAGLLSLSTTAPTMPAGYTYKARTGWVRTDGSANKYPAVFDQKGSRVQVEGASGLPIMGSSTGGSTATTVAWGNFAPPTAGVLHLVTTAYPASGYSFSFVGDAANIYGGCSYGITASKDRAMVSFVPKGTTVPWYYANLGSGTVTLEMAGWEDNL